MDRVKRFLEDVQAILDGKEPVHETTFVLHRSTGLCSNFRKWLRAEGMSWSEVMDADSALAEAFKASGLDEEYPFNENATEYDAVTDKYIKWPSNIPRLAWIRAQVI